MGCHVFRTQKHATVHPPPLRSTVYTWTLELCPKAQSQIQTLHIPGPHYKCNPNLGDDRSWQAKDEHAVWTSRHIQKQVQGTPYRTRQSQRYKEKRDGPRTQAFSMLPCSTLKAYRGELWIEICNFKSLIKVYLSYKKTDYILFSIFHLLL